jgi:hypothetical protein
MAAYAFQLLVNFLQDHQFFALLKIVNQYLSVRVLVSRPVANAGPATKTAASLEAKPAGIVGLSAAAMSHVNSESISWGVTPFDPANETEILKALRSDLSSGGSFKVHWRRMRSSWPWLIVLCAFSFV